MAPLQRSKSSTQTDQLQIQHFIHQHPLHKLYMTSEFNCDGCNTGGYGVRYRCSACDFDLHEQCATASHRISSSLHPHHHLVLINRPGGDSHFCHVCKGVTNGLSYGCEIQTCGFNVHTLCTHVPAATATGEKSLTLNGYTTAVGGYNGVSNSQPVMVNHHQQQMQAMHTITHSPPAAAAAAAVPTMGFGGYHGANNSPHMTVNHQQPPPQKQEFGGYHGMNNNQTQMINNHQQQPLKQGIPMNVSGGYHGANNNQTQMSNHQQQQGIAATGFGGYHGVNTNQTQMINHHQPQQQAVGAAGFGGYQGGMNSQPVMVNHHHQQQQMMPTMAFNTNQQFVTNQQQQQHQQQMGMPGTAVGGYNVVNNNQTVMIHQPPPPPPPPPQQASGYTKMGKLAANILSTSLIGVPIFMPKR